MVSSSTLRWSAPPIRCRPRLSPDGRPCCPAPLLPHRSVHTDHEEPQGQRYFPEAGGQNAGGQIVREPGDRKVSQPKPAIAIPAPRIRGRKLDLKIGEPIRRQ